MTSRLLIIDWPEGAFTQSDSPEAARDRGGV